MANFCRASASCECVVNGQWRKGHMDQTKPGNIPASDLTEAKSLRCQQLWEIDGRRISVGREKGGCYKLAFSIEVSEIPMTLFLPAYGPVARPSTSAPRFRDGVGRAGEPLYTSSNFDLLSCDLGRKFHSMDFEICANEDIFGVSV